MAVLIQFNLIDEGDRVAIAQLLGVLSGSLPVEPAQVARVDAPAPAHVCGAAGYDPMQDAMCPACEPAPEYTDEFMREQFRSIATKVNCREAAFEALAKYGNGKRSLGAVDKAKYPALLAEWRAIGEKA